MTQPSSSPYIQDATLELKCYNSGPNTARDLPEPGLRKSVTVRIEDVLTTTMSVVLKVSIVPEVAYSAAEQDNRALAPMILKLYDRRFASDMREKAKTTITTTAELESGFFKLVQTGKLAQFLETLKTDGYDREDLLETEAYLFSRCVEMHQVEIRVYNTLQSYQGTYVPLFFADVRLSTTGNDGYAEYFDVRGMLIEYIEGFPLCELVATLPESEWAQICNSAIRGIQCITRHNFTNIDIQTRNCIVRQFETGDGNETAQYQVVYFDFGHCDYRPVTDTDEMWRDRKRQRDEEGAIGYPLDLSISLAKGKKGKRYKGPSKLPWTYRPSNRFAGPSLE